LLYRPTQRAKYLLFSRGYAKAAAKKRIFFEVAKLFVAFLIYFAFLLVDSAKTPYLCNYNKADVANENLPV